MNQHRFIYSGDTVYVGCVSVALGQILAYHRNPISLDWDSILQGEAHRQAFLKDLAYSLESSFGETGTGASLVEVKNYLSYNDYSYTQIKHNNNLVIGSLSNQRPVYMEGDREREDPLFYETADSYSTSTARSQGLHMNWGWGGTNNGYYHDSDINYQENRKELINIHP